MRLLPRSPRGTWLLAGAVWAAGCAASWWALPVRPRAEWALSEEERLLGFLPNGVLVTSHIDTGPDQGHEPFCGPVRLWDSASGRCLRQFLTPEVTFQQVRIS